MKATVAEAVEVGTQLPSLTVRFHQGTAGSLCRGLD